MGDVIDTLEGVIDSISDVLDDVVDSVLGGISDVLGDIADRTGLTAETLIHVIRSSFSKLYNFLGYLSNTLGNFISAPLSHMARIFEAVLSAVVNNLFHSMDLVWRGFGQLKDIIVNSYKWIQDKLSSLYNLIAQPTGSLIRKVADAVSKYFGATISWLTDTVKSLYRKVTEYFEPEISWIKHQISNLYNFYDEKIAPALAKITDTIHKVAVLTGIYKDLTEGRLFEAFLEGISIADRKLAEKIAKIAKAWDGTAKGLLRALGYTSGHISHILHDVEGNLNRMLRDVEDIIKNTGLRSLEVVEDMLRFVNKDIAQRLDSMLRGQNSLLRSIIYTITDPAVEAYMIVEDTIRDYHKYEPLIRAAELRKYNAITPRPYFPMILIPPFRR